ncbi:hypothetical protein BC829DRAFT_235766 [Chytridium lagenaria]|nr:hypothetical protein BC829DRAFT_235766 [Chytridium lagenaria]
MMFFRKPTPDVIPETTLDIPTLWVRERRRVKGVVVRVGDADGFRMCVEGSKGWKVFMEEKWGRREGFGCVPKVGGEKVETVSVRLAGVDAPECAHFGAPAQPFSKEAKEWLAETILGKVVTITLLRMDQYGRVVAITELPNPRSTRKSIDPSSSQPLKFNIFTFLLPFLPGSSSTTPPQTPTPPPRLLNVSLKMLELGLAVVFEGQGAEYGISKDAKTVFLKAEKVAKEKGVGMWGARTPTRNGEMGRLIRQWRLREVEGEEEGE